jgi:hypothetical protein
VWRARARASELSTCELVQGPLCAGAKALSAAGLHVLMSGVMKRSAPLNPELFRSETKVKVPDSPS